MTLQKISLLLSLLFAFGVQLYGQSSINYLNGKVIKVKHYEINGERIVYVKTGDNSGKSNKISKFKVFSIVDKNGSEQIIYSKDSTVLYEMNEDEMRHFMMGEQFSRAHYKNNWNKIGGLASGLSGGVLGFYGLPVPLLYAIVNERVSPPIKYPKNVELPTGSEHEYFQYGYQKRSANKKMGQIFTFGGIGLALGITTFVLVFEN